MNQEFAESRTNGRSGSILPSNLGLGGKASCRSPCSWVLHSSTRQSTPATGFSCSHCATSVTFSRSPVGCVQKRALRPKQGLDSALCEGARMHAFLSRIDRFFPVRYLGWTLASCSPLVRVALVANGHGVIFALVAIVLALVGFGDLLQRQRLGAAQLSADRPHTLPARVHPPRNPPVLSRERQRGNAVLAPTAFDRLSAGERRRPTRRPFGTQLDQQSRATNGSITRLCPTEIATPIFA